MDETVVENGGGIGNCVLLVGYSCVDWMHACAW